MKIRNEVLKQIIKHAREVYPLEACGYLADKEGLITQAYALTNIDNSSEHFSFEPKEQFQTLKDARAKGLNICAVYHSHPCTPARPSDEDIKLAYDPEMLYVIVSLSGKEDIKAFRIRDEKVYPVELEVTIDEGI